MIFRLALLSGLALVAACSASALPAAETAMRPAQVAIAQAAPDVRMAHAAALMCEVTTARGPDGLRVDAVAHAGAPIQGDYDVRIRSAGPRGDSDVVQNGPVTLASGESATLGSTVLASGRRAQTRVTFTVRDADGEACRVERRI